MWYNNSTIYQIYPLGYCGAPKANDGIAVSRIKRIADAILYAFGKTEKRPQEWL